MISRRAFAQLAAAAPALRAADPKPALVSFDPPWSSPYRPDPRYPHQLVNGHGDHLFLLNKTAWAYFGCKDPQGFVQRAAQQGVTVIRVALEGRPYFEQLGVELWPWRGTRAEPDWSGFHDQYWDRVEERIAIAGRAGLGFDIVLYFTLKPDRSAIEQQRPYWQHLLRRLSKYANVLTWEIANEYIRNEEFQDAAARYLRENDPWKHPVCTSDGTTDDAAWPHKDWTDLAVVHTCTGSTPAHEIREWYQSVARNVRSYGKPAFNNESGRENRHRNDDPLHRRKQAWTWCACGGFWTWHSWEGCEGIEDADYRGPGQEYLRPMSDFFRSIDFWRLDPNHTALIIDPAIVNSTLAAAGRSLVITYLCTPRSGTKVETPVAKVRLPTGRYRLSFFNPADLAPLGSAQFTATAIGNLGRVTLPSFVDDLLVKVEKA